jgi:hypothetical protein
MAKVYKQIWTVEGALSFPVDMLRYDGCFPADETQSHIINRTMDGSTGKVQVKVARYRRSDMTLHPTVGRWNSFGWQYVEGSLTQEVI